jgi:hypothetical protein
VLEKPAIKDLRARAALSLAGLEKAIARDLEILEYPSKRWMPVTKGPEGQHVYDVIVVGGGHCGVTAAFALMRERISNILVLEKNPVGEEGPWQTYARMPDLRTRKAVAGNELGYVNLTFRAYYEAREGEEAYAELKRISCDEWTCYLLWLRKVLGIPVQNGTELLLIEPEGNLFRLQVLCDGATEILYARRVVMTSGPVSMGGSVIPDIIGNSLPAKAYAPAMRILTSIRLLASVWWLSALALRHLIMRALRWRLELQASICSYDAPGYPLSASFVGRTPLAFCKHTPI